MGLLIYASVTLLLALTIQKKKSKFLLLLLQLLPFLFIFVFLWFTRSNYQVLQVKKVGYQFEKVTNDYRQPSRSILIGGDQQKDDLFAAGLPPAAIKLSPSLASTNIDVEVMTDGLILMRNEEIANAVPLKQNDRIQCDGQDYVYHTKGAFDRRFSVNQKEWVWPKKDWRIKKTTESLPTTNGSSTHLFSEIVKATGGSCKSNAILHLQRIEISATRQPVQINTILLTGGNHGITLNQAQLPNRFSFSDGDALKIYTLDHNEEQPRYRLIASHVLNNGETFRVLHSTPQTLGIKEELLRNGSKLNKPLLISTSSLPYSVFPTAHYSKESRHFSGLYAFVQTREQESSDDLLDQMEERLMKFLSMGSTTFEVVTDEGTFRPSFGDYFALGRNDKIIFSIHQVQFPWILLQILMVLFLLKALYQPPFFNVVENRSAQLLLLLVDFFLVTRVLFSWRAFTVYPFSAETTPLSLLALLLVPYMLFCAALSARKTWERTHFYNFACYTLFVLIITAILLPAYLWLSVILSFGFCSFSFLKFHPRSPLRDIHSMMDSLKNLTMDAYLLMFFSLALMLQLFGAGEAIYVAGVRFPLAIIYHPVFLIFSTYYAYQLKQTLRSERNAETKKQVLMILVKCVLVMLCFLAISLFTADLGFFLLYCMPVLFLGFGIGVLFISEYEVAWKSLGLAMVAPLALFLLVFTGSSLLDEILPVSSFSNRYIQRILLSVDPGALENAGLLTTERQLGHQRTFLAYARSGIFGGGYMNRPINPALTTTALNDNVPSAFLLNDFGVAGFIAVLLVLSGFALFWLTAGSPAITGYIDLLSLAALMTLLFVDMYMIFSNCGIFLFTGKNVFLWGLNSISDIFHSTFLFALIVIGASRRTITATEQT